MSAKEVLVNLKHTFLDIDDETINKPQIDGEVKKEPVVLHLYHVLRMAATVELPEDSQGGSQKALETKMELFDINAKLGAAWKAGKTEVVLLESEVKAIKARIAMCWNTLVAIPAIRHIEEGVKPHDSDNAKAAS